VKVIANNPTPDGCSGVQEVNFDVEVFEAPTADFSIVSSGCLADAVNIIDNTNNSRPTVRWNWDFGDATTDTTKNPVKFYSSEGNYNIRLRTITDIGCLAEVAKPFNISSNPVARFGVAGLPCTNSAITFGDTSTVTSGSISKWSWRFGNGDSLTATNNNSPGITYKAPGTYNVSLQVQTAAGCRSATVTKPVTIYAMPVSNFIMPQVCLSDAIATFRDSSFMSDGSAASLQYRWDFADPNATGGNPNTSSQQNPAHTYSATGFYNVNLSVTSPDGCSAITTKQFIVNGSVPKADFNVLRSASLCSNLPVEIENTSGVDFGSITKVEISWDAIGAPSTVVIDNFPLPNKIYSHVYPLLQSTQTYQVKFSAYSGIRCVDEKVKSITVNASPKTSFTTMPGICFEANPRQVTQANGGGIAGTGMFTGSGVSPSGLFSPSVAGAGTHVLRYVYTSDRGCKDSIDKPITVWPSPTAAWAYSSPTCINDKVSFSDSSLANFGNINQWNWNFGDGTNAVYANSTSFVKSYTNTGSFTTTLQVKTDSGCVSTVSSKAFIIHPKPKVDFSMPSVCLPAGQATFTNLSTIADATQNAFSYLWNFGDASNLTTSSQKDPTHKYTTTGPFNVQLVVTSGDGCSDSITKMFTTIYPKPKADFTVSPNDTCLGGTFYFNDLSNGVTSNITNWNWSFGDGTISTVQNPTRKYTAARTFNIVLSIVNAQGCVGDTSRSVVVHPYPSVNAGQDLFVLEGGSAVLNATASGSNLSYRWTPGTYLNNDSILKPSTSAVDDVTYRLTVTSIGGCKGYDDVVVKVLKSPSIPNVFSPNGDGVNDVWVIRYLETYPGNSVQVFNRYGQQVFVSNGYAKPWDGTLKGSPLPAGVYYYIIDPKHGRNAYKGSVTILR
jgi:gliding motility-associated-like protein